MANYCKKDGHAFYHRRHLIELDEAILFSIFDQNTDMDIQEIEQEIQAKKLFKRVCLFKTLTFPLEILLFGVFDRQQLHIRWQQQKICFKFLANKIDLNKFKSEMNL